MLATDAVDHFGSQNLSCSAVLMHKFLRAVTDFHEFGVGLENLKVFLLLQKVLLEAFEEVRQVTVLHSHDLVVEAEEKHRLGTFAKIAHEVVVKLVAEHC